MGETVVRTDGFKSMQKTVLEKSTSVHLDIYRAFDGERVDFDLLEKAEMDLRFLLERVQEWNGNA